MKKVLVISYSQSGQLSKFVKSATKPLCQNEDIQVDYHILEPVKAYPYPWRFYPFFDAFPEAVYMNGCEVKPASHLADDYDLIIIGYTVWFLSPAIPVTGYLKTDQAKQLLKDKPVVTLIACRDMWVMAQEKMKLLINECGGHLIDNAVLTDQSGTVYSFITTPRWMLTGKKDPFWVFPAAGVSEQDINDSARFGERLALALSQNMEKEKKPLLTNLRAVKVNGKLISSEKIATRSFMIWGKLIQSSGKPGAFPRKVMITVYVVFLIAMIFTLVPINLLAKKLISPLMKNSIEKSIEYYEKPSGR